MHPGAFAVRAHNADRTGIRGSATQIGNQGFKLTEREHGGLSARTLENSMNNWSQWMFCSLLASDPTPVDILLANDAKF